MSTPAKRVATWLKVGGFAGLVVVVLAIWLILDPPGSDSGTAVPAPDGEMAVATAEQLARASTAQGVCYGWRLDSGMTVTSTGSNLGNGVAVDSDPARCPRWVEVRASVVWTAASSESPDTADVSIAGTGVPPPPAGDLGRFGLDGSTFVDDPDWAICQAALALPLLLAERGAVSPAPTAAPGTAGGPQPDAGSDFWRGRWQYMSGAALLLALATLIIGIGWFERKHERTRATRVPTAPKPPESPVNPKPPEASANPKPPEAPVNPKPPEAAAGT